MMKRIAFAALAAVLAVPATAQDIADTIYFGGPILTMDDAAPRTEAVAVKEGTIIAVGDLADLSVHQGDGTRTFDLQGRALLPGFVDAHGHAMMIGLQALSANMLPAPDGEVNDIPTLQRVLTEFAEAFPDRVEAGGMILGFGYDDSQLAELRHPTREDLDAVSTEVPVAIIHQSGHIGVLNSKALEVVGFDASTPERPGGVIRRESDGAPNGVLEETPFFEALMTLLSDLDEDGMRVMFRAGTELLASYGYTTGQDGRSSTGQAQLMQAVASEDGLDIDVVSYPDVLIDRDFIAQNARRDYVDGFRVAGAKLTIDGSPQGFTAFRDRPYYDPPENLRGDYVGYTAVTNDQIFDAIDWAFANDIQILTHSNGEGASDILIAAIRQATETHGPDDRRPVLIHGQFQREDQVQAFVDLGVFPSLFPMHTFYWGDWHRDRTVGPVLAENISPTQWYLKRGSMFSSHHDAPVAFPDSMRILDATVTRRSRSNDIIGPDQRVDVMTALKAMTIWPAFQHFEEDRKGSIEVGKVADFVILSDDPTAVDPETLDRLTVMRTIKGDVVVYDVENVRDGNLLYRPGPGDQGTFAQVLMAGAPWIGQPAPTSAVDVAIRRAMARQADPHAALHAIDRVMGAMLGED
jgi:predicted amidohydrolase YtcJ